ncbi:tolloid-like protein 2 [Amphiura filiformis]|uniref:tolloid-like protein 2 n=1 Tax=Amphiura filiformis TaxID=82378 RepID=UPI003B20F1FA
MVRIYGAFTQQFSSHHMSFLGECGIRYIRIGSNSEVITLTSPGYPKSYGNNLVCEWSVSATELRRIVIRIIDFEMEDVYDFLIIGDGENSVNGSILVSLNGDIKLNTLTSTGSKMWIKLVTDQTGVARFHLNLTQVANIEGICKSPDYDCGEGFCVDSSAVCNEFSDCPNNVDEKECGNTTCPGSYLCEETNTTDVRMCINMNAVCDGTSHCPTGDDEISCGDCGRTFFKFVSNSEVITLTSPGYPMSYGNNLVCEWSVSATESRRIVIRIVDFEMEDGYDFLTFGDGENSVNGSILVSLTGTIKLNTLTSTGSMMWIKLATDLSGVARGFNLNLTQVANMEGKRVWCYFQWR